MLNRDKAVAIVVDSVRSQLELDGVEPDGPIDEGSTLIGENALVDSLGLVNVIIEVEQVLLTDYGVAVTVVDERAMSMSQSPFRTVGTLAEYVTQLAVEAA